MVVSVISSLSLYECVDVGSLIPSIEYVHGRFSDFLTLLV